MLINIPGISATPYSSASLFPTAAAEGALAVATDTGLFYGFVNGSWDAISGSGGGGVSSVAATTPSLGILQVTGSPITSSGTLVFTYSTSNGPTIPWLNQAGNNMFAGNPLTTNALVYMAGNGPTSLSNGTSGQVLTSNGSSLPSFQNFSAASFGTQSAHAVLVGPTSGSAANPTFRSLVTSDLPSGTGSGNLVYATSPTLVTPSLGAATATSLSVGGVTGLLADGTVNAGGVFNAASLTSASSLPYINTYNVTYLNADDGTTTSFVQGAGAGSTLTLTLPGTQGGANTILQNNGSGVLSWVTKPTGTVTGVGLSVPSFLSVSGSPVTTSGTLAVSLSGTALPITSGGTGVTSVTTSPTASSFAAWDSNKNLSANNFVPGFLAVTSSGTTTTLTAASPKIISITGSTTQIVKLPPTNTLAQGHEFAIYNLNTTTGNVTVQTAAGTAFSTVLTPLSYMLATVRNTGNSGVPVTDWQWVTVGSTPVVGLSGPVLQSPVFNSQAKLTASSFVTGAVTIGSGDLPYTMDNTTQGLIVVTSGGGSLTEKILLPDPSTVELGQSYEIVNRGSGFINIKVHDDTSLVGTIQVGQSCIVALYDSTHWQFSLLPSFNSGSSVQFTGVLRSATGSATFDSIYLDGNYSGSGNGPTIYPHPTTPADFDLILPDSNAAGALTNDGSGNLSWSASGSGITSMTGDVSASVSGGVATTTVDEIQGTTVSGTTGTGNVVFDTAPTLNGLTVQNLSGAVNLQVYSSASTNSSGIEFGYNTGTPTNLWAAGMGIGDGSSNFNIYNLGRSEVEFTVDYVSGNVTIPSLIAPLVSTHQITIPTSQVLSVYDYDLDQNVMTWNGASVGINNGTPAYTLDVNGTFGVNGAATFSGYTAGAVPFFGSGGLLSQNTTNLIWDDSSTALGIGTATPAAYGSSRLTVDSDANLAQLATLAGHTYTPTLSFAMSGGTAASPTSVTNGTGVGSISFKPYVDSGYQQSALIGAEYVDDGLAGHFGTEILVFTTPVGSSSNQLAAVFGPSGDLQVTGPVTGSNLSGTNTGDVTLGTANGLSLSGQALSLQAADATHTGALSSADWSTFNNKQSALTFSNSLSNSSGTVTLVNDSATPGNSKYYGTNGSGTLGYFNLPSGGSGTVTSFSFTNQNNMTGTVTNATTTPTLAIVPTSGSPSASGFAAWDTSLNLSARGFLLNGSSSGTVSILPQATAGTYNFNLPTSAGSSGNVLTSGGGSSSPMTWTSVASANTASAIVQRDSSGNFSAGTITASLTGTASGNATKALDNLASVAINTSLLPGTDNSINLGSSSKQWANIFAGTQIQVGGANGLQFLYQTTSTSYPSPVSTYDLIGTGPAQDTLVIASPNASGSSRTGSIYISSGGNAGNNFNPTGDITITTGTGGTSQSSGSVTISTGAGGATGSPSGNINITTGLAGATSGGQGNIVMGGGNSNGYASVLPNSNGNISFGSSSAVWKKGWFTDVNVGSLTASQAVVTDSSKNLASLAYATAATASALVQRDSNANVTFNNFNPTNSTYTGSGTLTLTNTAALCHSMIYNQGGQWDFTLPSSPTAGRMFLFPNGSQSGGVATVTGTAAPSGGSVTTTINAGELGIAVYGDSVGGDWCISKIPLFASTNTAKYAVIRDASGNFAAGAITATGLTVSGLTASQVVVTNGSKALASLAYATAATASTIAQRDSNANLALNNALWSSQTLNPTGTDVTFTAASPNFTIFGGSSVSSNILLPSTSTIPLGTTYRFVNTSPGSMFIQTSTGASIVTMPNSGFNGGSIAEFRVVSTSGNTAAAWSYWISSKDPTLANGTLSNLTGNTSISVDVLPDQANTRSLGSSSLPWANVFGNLHALKGTSSGTITIQPQAAAGTYNFNLPTSAGTSGQVLTSGGGSSAAMTWTTLNSVSGSQSSPTTITASGGITAVAGSPDQLWVTQSASGAVNITANPQISAGTVIGQKMTVIGSSSSNYIIFADGNGLSLNGSCIIDNNGALNLIWNGSVWYEISRR